eukprot:264329_1
MKDSLAISKATMNLICLLLLVMLFRNLYQTFKDNDHSNKTRRGIKISVTLIFGFNIIYSIGQMVLSIVQLLTISDVESTKETNDIQNISDVISYIFYLLYLVTVSYFLLYQLILTFQKTFLKIRQTPYKMFFIIHLTTISFVIIAIFVVLIGSNFNWYDWNDKLKSATFPKPYAILKWIYQAVGIIYYLTILISFNTRYYTYISLTLINSDPLADEHSLSTGAEGRLIITHKIAKQTCLISIIIITSISMFILDDLQTDYKILPGILLIINVLYNAIVPLCIYFNVPAKDDEYHAFCCICDKACEKACSMLFYCHKANNITSDFIINDGSNRRELSTIDSITHTRYSSFNSKSKTSFEQPHNAIKNSFTFDTECKSIEECPSVNQLCKSIPECKVSEDRQQENILDNFIHCLKYHDTDDNFYEIYVKLTAIKKCLFDRCGHWKSRTTQYRQVKTHGDISDDHHYAHKMNLLQRIHSYYYHSQEAGFRTDRGINRNRVLQTANTNMKKDSINMDEMNHNRFSSDLNLKQDDVISCMYSFGQRFEYKNKGNYWFVDRKYTNFKDELLDNSKCKITFIHYESEKHAAKEAMNCKYVIHELHNKSKGRKRKKLSWYHILSLKIYCNCDSYQYEMSKTFRKEDEKETDESLKRRHSVFRFSSKYLRELVEHFGSSLDKGDDYRKVFYHGTSKILFLTKTITRFCGPLSTSSDRAVAQKFSYGEGLVFELKYSFSIYPSNSKYFFCAPFSEFPHEKECLFIGGIPFLIITNITNVKDDEVYTQFINALNVVNCLLNGTFDKNENNFKYSKAVGSRCCLLLRYFLTSTHDKHRQTKTIPDYISHLLVKYCINLKRIVIFWHHLVKCGKLLNLFCDVDDTNSELMFFNLEILNKLFPNLEQIEYYHESISKHQTEQIIEYLRNTYIKSKNLKYIIFHIRDSVQKSSKNSLSIWNSKASAIFSRTRNSTTSLLIDVPKQYESTMNSKWNLYEDDQKIIFHKQLHFYPEQINYGFDEILQGNTSKQMLDNLK